MMNEASFSPLLTDFYQLLMAYGYFKSGLDQQEAVFHLFFRRKPFGGGFAIAAGLETAIQAIEQFHFSESDLDYLRSLGQFDESFLNYLKNLKLEVDIEAAPEGSVVFPFEPMLRVRGPLLACQLLESPLLNYINFASLIATKAARIRIAAGNDSVMEFGLRRAQGPNGALTASRAAFIGGADSTSNLLAGKIYGIPVRGTQAHSWIMAFESEEEAFLTYGRTNPQNCLFLVDTYDTIEGVKKAISAAKKLEKEGIVFQGIRLDSGDLTYLSIRARALLDEAGYREAKIVASNELDEQLISELKRQGAQISVWGVGTHLVTGSGQPYFDGVYKLSGLFDGQGRFYDKIKLSEQLIKVSTPGILQVCRFEEGGEYLADMIYDTQKPLAEWATIIDPLDPTRIKKMKGHLTKKELMVPVLIKGKRVYSPPTLSEIQAYAKSELKRFSAGIKRFLNPHQYMVGLEESLYLRKNQLVRERRQ